MTMSLCPHDFFPLDDLVSLSKEEKCRARMMENSGHLFNKEDNKW